MPPEVQVAEPITATTEAPKTGADVFAEARASIAAQSKDQGATDTGTTDDNAATTKPAQDTEKVADELTETTEQSDSLLSPEEVGKLSAKERTLYEKAQKVFTQKTQAMAAERKGYEEWNPLIEGLKDPAKRQATLESVAKQLGFEIKKPESQDTKTSTADDLPEDLQFLKPVFEAREKALEARIRAELQPVKEAHAAMATEAAAAETQSTIEAFTAKHPEWQKHEPQMLALAQKFVPAPGAKMTDLEYMDHLFKLATSSATEAEQAKKVIEKINKSAASSEERTSGIPKERVAHVIPPPGKRSLKEAYEAAKRGEVWETN